ncbi:MAG: choice-of-anchor B family protein [Phaeodactylibacter sp.]|nr:choice-of-anchor B family protein [Phaeodactylibacter sp.]
MQRLLTLLLICTSPFFTSAQDSLNLTALSHWNDSSLPALGSLVYNDIWGYTAPDGREYAILGNVGATVFFDITAPDAIVEVARIPGQLNSVWRDYKTYGQYAYMCADQGNEGLTIFDLRQLPDTVIQVSQNTTFFNQAHNIFVDEANGRLYAAGGNNPSNGVTILDLTQDPSAPTLLGNPVLPAGGYVHDIFVRDNIAYCSHGNNGLSVYDLTDPGNPVTLGTLPNYPEQGYNHSSWLTEDGSHLVFADETFGRSVKMTDVSNLQEMEVVDLFKSELLAPQATGSIAHNPFVRGNYVIISYYHEGVQIFDLSDPENVEQFAYYDTHPQNTNYQGFDGCWGVYPFFPSGSIIASDTENGLYVLRPQGWSFEPQVVLSASLNQTGIVQLCETETVDLFATISGDAWIWEKDGIALPNAPSDTLTIGESGQYYLVNTSGDSILYSDTLEVQVTTTTEFAGLDTAYQFCPGSSLEISIGTDPGFDSIFLVSQVDFQIIGNYSFDAITIPETGNYALLGTLNGCRGESSGFEIVQLSEAPSPEVLPFIPPICEGDSIIIELGEGLGYTYNITALDVSFSDSSQIHVPAGIYTIAASNGICDTLFSVGLTPAPLPQPGIEQVGDSLICDLTSSGLFIWLYEGTPIDTTTTPYFLPELDGTYQVGAQNEAFCWGYSEIINVVLTSTSEVTRDQFSIFPNPATEQLHIDSRTLIEQVLIRNQLGQQVFNQMGYTAPLYLGKLPAGSYLISIKLEGSEWTTRKFIKK